MAPSRFPSFRGRPSPAANSSTSSTSSSSADTTGLQQQLVALRYESTIQAAPPIPIPPPRNPLRLSAAACPASSAVAAVVVVPPPVTSPLAHRAFGRYALPAVEHSPWHVPSSSSSSSPSPSPAHSHAASVSTACTDWKRDSAWGTIASATTTATAATTVNDADPCPTSDRSTGGPVPRYSCQSRWSLSDSDSSDRDPDDKDETTTQRLMRTLSARLAAPPMKRTKRPSRGAVPEAAAEAAPYTPPLTASFESRRSRDATQPDHAPAHPLAHPHRPPQGSPAPSPANHDESQSPNASIPGPLSDNLSASISAPTISTDIPAACILDDDVLDSINFSNRGSIYFGGKRAISAPIPVRAPASMDCFSAPRAAPPAPAAADAATDAHPAPSPDAKNSSLPDIRVMSVDTERESQKVRSLYESGDLIDWRDGAPVLPSAEPLESPVELASDGEDNTAGPTGKEHRKSVRALYLCPTSPLSVTSLPPPRDSHRRNQFELAGGIEDWEDIDGEDVDRYGFITAGTPRPSSRQGHRAETRSLHTTPTRPRTPGRRNGRNVLTKRHRGPPISSGLSRIPSRKVSARSLHTQTSAVSASSRLSVRSGLRTAANILPHNRDRRIIDAAGDMLSLPPGLAGVEDEQKSAQATRAAQDREARRTEKWRKMAKIFTKVTDGKGGEFNIHTMSKKVKKEMSTDGKHFQIQGMNIEFDTKNPKLVERTWKGIPDRWRAAAWYYFLSVSAKQSQDDPTEEQLFVDFHRLQETSSPDDVQIDLDVPRTINRHIMFRKRYRGGQRLLFRVLHALSLYFPETGYVQGMAALAASLLCYYDEERCFVMLVRLWTHRGLARLYQPGFAGLMIALQDLEKHWLKGKQVSDKLNELGIDPTAYGTRWYLTLFNLSIPFPAQLRVWDVFMLLGGTASLSTTGSSREKEKAKEPEEDDMVFNGLDIIHATAAALIDMHQEVIIGGDFENVMKGLTSFQNIKDEDRFMSLVRAEWNTHRVKKRS